MSTAHIPSRNSRTRNSVTNAQLVLNRDPLSRPPVFRPSLRSWSNGATSCSKRGGKVFLIVFKTREALPLTFVRFWRPRSSRVEGAEQPRHASDSGPRHQPVRESDWFALMTRVQKIRVRAQSATEFRPHPWAQQETVLNRSRSLASTVREQASAMKTNFPQPVRNLEPSTAPVAPHAKSINGWRLAGKRPPHRIAVSVLPTIHFTVRIRNISSHEHL